MSFWVSLDANNCVSRIKSEAFSDALKVVVSLTERPTGSAEIAIKTPFQLADLLYMKLVDGFLEPYTPVQTQEDLDALALEIRKRYSEEIDREFKQRLSRGMTFDGDVYQIDDRSQLRIAVMMTAALDWQAEGGSMTEVNWNDGSPLYWRLMDNSFTTLTPLKMRLLAHAAKARFQALLSDSYALKDADPMADNISDDAHWTE